MNKIKILHSILIFVSIILSPYVAASALDKTIEKTNKKIWIKFKEEPLSDVVNYFASHKKINVILPQGDDALKAKLTFSFDEKTSLEKSWQTLITILDISGYTLVPRKDFVVIVKKPLSSDGQPNREPYNLYINVKPEDLPESDERIRYIAYLTTIQVPAPGDGTSSLSVPLKNLLSEGATYLFEQTTNAIIIIDKARVIKSVMDIIIKLDKAERGQTLEVVQCVNTKASTIALLLSVLSGADTSSQQQPAFYGMMPKKNDNGSSYFPQNVNFSIEPRTNKLVMIGPLDAIQRIKEFITKYIDVPIQSGKSVVHVYELQYLDAQTFSQTLLSIISSGSQGSSYQQSTGSQDKGTVSDWFQGVIIAVEDPSTATANTTPYQAQLANTGLSGTNNSTGTTLSMGNKLIIAAKKEDWIRIEKLIKELDKPQQQVALEALIVSFNHDDVRALGNQMRNKSNLSLPGSANFQTSHLGSIVTKGQNVANLPTTSDALAADLLTYLGNTGASSLATNSATGSSIISFADGTNGIWLLTQMLNKMSNTRIISHPFAVAINNTPTIMNASENRSRPAEAVIKQGVTRTENRPFTASLIFKITPLINSSQEVNLNLDIGVEEFGSTDDGTKTTREVITNSNIKSGDILVIGGLIRNTTTITLKETPLLGSIPIIGQLFKFKQKNETSDNLMVFLRPTIIVPRSQQTDIFTASKLTRAKTLLSDEEELFGTLKDPINRWFFGTNKETNSDVIERYEENNKEKSFISDAVDATKNSSIKKFVSPPLLHTKTSDAEKAVEQDLKNLFASL